MDEIQAIVIATAERLFEDHYSEDVVRASRRGELRSDVWAVVVEAGLPLALVPEPAGGFGFGAEMLDLARIAGRHGAALPLGEAMIANRILADSGLDVVEGVATFAIEVDKGTAYAPWGGSADVIVLVSAGGVARLERGAFTTTRAPSISGLARDTVRYDAVDFQPSPWTPDAARAAGATLRVMEVAGILERVTDMTIAYANERVQFGKPLSKQQAIQQQLAVLATHTAAASAAATLAIGVFGHPNAMLAVAAAKSRASEAAGTGAAIAHQVHGAIGFTEEHRLQLYTRFLWGVRDEYGSARWWEERLGDAVLNGGGAAFWPLITALSAQGATT